MSAPKNYHDIPLPDSTAAGRRNADRNGKQSLSKQWRHYRPNGALPTESPVATVSRFSARLIDRVTGQAFSADELVSKILQDGVGAETVAGAQAKADTAGVMATTVSHIEVAGAAYTLAATNGYRNVHHNFTSVIPVQVTLPAGIAYDATRAHVWTVVQRGVGQVSIAGASGVTVVGNRHSAGQSSALLVVQTGANTYEIIGGVPLDENPLAAVDQNKIFAWFDARQGTINPSGNPCADGDIVAGWRDRRNTNLVAVAGFPESVAGRGTYSATQRWVRCGLTGYYVALPNNVGVNQRPRLWVAGRWEGGGNASVAGLLAYAGSSLTVAANISGGITTYSWSSNLGFLEMNTPTPAISQFGHYVSEHGVDNAGYVYSRNVLAGTQVTSAGGGYNYPQASHMYVGQSGESLKEAILTIGDLTTVEVEAIRSYMAAKYA